MVAAVAVAVVVAVMGEEAVEVAAKASPSFPDACLWQATLTGRASALAAAVRGTPSTARQRTTIFATHRQEAMSGAPPRDPDGEGVRGTCRSLGALAPRIFGLGLSRR